MGVRLRAWLDQCSFLALGTYKCMVAVRREHPPGRKEAADAFRPAWADPDDGEGGDSGLNDRLRASCERTIRRSGGGHPSVLRYFRVQPLRRNRACATYAGMLAGCPPGLVSLPVEWEYAVPYGLLYATSPCPDVERFVRTAERAADRIRTEKSACPMR